MPRRNPAPVEYRMSLRDGAAWISDEMMEVMEDAIEDDHYYTNRKSRLYADRYIEQARLSPPEKNTHEVE